MAKRRRTQSARSIPKVRMACPEGRLIQLRYTCPVEKREIRISTGTKDIEEAERQKAELEARLLPQACDQASLGRRNGSVLHSQSGQATRIGSATV